MRRLNLDLLWVAQTPNRKTGNVPTAYVGLTLAEARASCEGCELGEQRECYAWSGFTRLAFAKRIRRRNELLDYNPRDETYTLAGALTERSPAARAARIAALGDPAHVDPAQLVAALVTLQREGLAPLVYTHHWRDPIAAHMQTYAMASCDTTDQADEALRAGWSPAVVLPWDHYETSGPTFWLGPKRGQLGVVCPAQTKPGVTCNDCRLCSKAHPAWGAGRLKAIGFLDHSAKAGREKRRGKQLAMFSGGRDTRARRS